MRTDTDLLRPAEVEHLIGDSSKARLELKWKPLVNFHELVHMMVDADLDRLSATSGRGDDISPKL